MHKKRQSIASCIWSGRKEYPVYAYRFSYFQYTGRTKADSLEIWIEKLKIEGLWKRIKDIYNL